MPSTGGAARKPGAKPAPRQPLPSRPRLDPSLAQPSPRPRSPSAEPQRGGPGVRHRPTRRRQRGKAGAVPRGRSVAVVLRFPALCLPWAGPIRKATRFPRGRCHPVPVAPEPAPSPCPFPAGAASSAHAQLSARDKSAVPGNAGGGTEVAARRSLMPPIRDARGDCGAAWR